MLVESLVLAGMGAAVGVLLAWWGVRAAVRLMLSTPSAFSLPRLQEISIDPWVLAFVALVTVATAVLFGLVPALVSRPGDLRGVSLASRSATSGRRLQSAMVVAEVALALPLLVGAGLMVHSFVRLSQVEPGFRAEGVLTVKMLLLPARERAFHAEFINQVLDRSGRFPGWLPRARLADCRWTAGTAVRGTYRADRPEPALNERPGGDISIITPDYFRAMGIPLVKGRDFDDRDRIGAPHVAILNQTAARMFFGDEDPLGKRLTVSWNDAREVEIIGITADIRHGQLQSRPDPSCSWRTRSSRFRFPRWSFARSASRPRLAKP